MAETRKDIRLWAAGEYHQLGDAADWEEVSVVVDVYLDQTGYDPAWHLDTNASREEDDHYHIELSTYP